MILPFALGIKVFGALVITLYLLALSLSAGPLTQVIDEEKSQTKGLLYLIQAIGACAFMEHEVRHGFGISSSGHPQGWDWGFRS